MALSDAYEAVQARSASRHEPSHTSVLEARHVSRSQLVEKEMNTTEINRVYRGMVAKRKETFTDNARQILIEMKEKLTNGELEDSHTIEELYENICKTMKRRLLGRVYTSEKEKQLLLTLLAELTKVMKS